MLLGLGREPLALVLSLLGVSGKMLFGDILEAVVGNSQKLLEKYKLL